MSSVDDRVVNMRFNNSTFERAAAKTLATLAKLKSSLTFGSGKNGLDSLQDSANRFSMKGVDSQVEGSASHWSAWRTAGLIAFATVVHQAVRAGERILASFTIDPIKAGLQNYETKINAIQTILANTQSAGTNLKDVTGVLKELNTYANKTVYNFSEMVKNIGTFTAAGVALKPAVASIKGIANLAALSGSNSQQASTAMYQLSQAISAGQVHLQDWNSVVNAGMGGSVFQRALAQTAVAMGTLKKSQLELVGPMKTVTVNGNAFRQSLTPPPGGTSWLTSKVLTTALSTFTGDLKDGQLAAIGFSKEQIKAIQAQAKTAVNAATQIKTVTQLQEALKEEVGTAWGSVWETVLGNFKQAPKLLSPLHTFLENSLTQPVYRLNKLLEGWSKLGGRTKLIDGIKNAFKALGSVMKPIQQAFHDIIPPATAKSLYALTVRFTNFTKSLSVSDKTAYDIWRTFKGLFALFDIGRQIVSGIFHVFGILFGAISQGSGSILNLTGNLGDFIVSIDDALKKGGALNTFFDHLGHILAIPITLLATLAHAIGGLFDGFSSKDANGLSGALGRVNDRMKTLSNVGSDIQALFHRIGQTVQPVIQGIVNAFHNLGAAIAKSLQKGNFNQVLDVLNTGLLAGIVLLVKKFLSKGINFNVGQGIFGSIKESFETLTGSLKAMQTQIQSKTLLMIAGAIGILTASVVALSLVDSAALTKALKAMAAGFGELLGSMAILTKISGSAGFVKVPIIAGSMILLAGAVTLLTVAVRNLVKLSWNELKKGLVGVAALLGAVSLAVIPLSKNSAGMIRVGIGLTGIAVALNILYLAVKGFATLDWGQLGKGLAAVAGSLLAIAAGMRAMPKGLALQGAGLVAISIALNALYLAVKNFSSLSWLQMGKGLAAVAGSLLAIAIGMRAMPKGMLAQAAALVVVSLALMDIGKAVAQMGSLDWGTIGKGLATLAGALGVLALGLKLMSSSLPGAAALAIVAGALALFVPVLIALGHTPWQVIAIGLGTIAAAFAIFGAAGLLLAPVTPVLIGLGVAFLAFGAALALAGVGILAIGRGLGYLAEAGSKAVKILADVLETFIKKLPDLAVGLAKGIVQFIVVLGKNAPKLAKALGQIIEMILKVIVDNIPKIVQAGIKLILSLVQALTDNMPKILKAAADLIIAFLDGLGKNLPRVVDAGFKMVIKLLNGIADAIRNNLGAVLKAAFGIGTAILQGLWDGMSSIFSWIWGKISGFFGWLWDRIKGWFGISSPSKKMAEIGINLIKGLWQGITGVASWIWGKVSGFFTSLWNKITNIVKQVASIGKKIVKTLWDGWWGLNSWLWDKAKNFVLSIFDKIVNILGKFASIGSKLVRNIWDGISGLAGWLIGKVSDFIGNVADKIRELPGKIISVAGRMLDAGRHIMGSLFDGIKNALKGVGGFAADLGRTIVDGLISAINGLLHLPLSIPQITIPIPFAPDIHLGPYTILPKIPHLATGGLITKSGWALVGEKGAEVVQLPAGSKVNPHGTSPTITPVIDLTEVRKGVAELEKLLSVRPKIVAKLSLDIAANISDINQKNAQPSTTTPDTTKAPQQVTFEQNNYSPKALTTVDIYRQTKNQLAQAKQALGVP